MTGRILFALLLATLVAQHWFASTPLPLGGPNIVLGGLTALFALSLVILRLLQREGEGAGAPMLCAAFRPAAPVIALSLLLLAWALVVHLRTDTSAPVRLAQVALGIGVLCATCLCVDSVRRAALMALAFVAATFASAVFGLAVAFIGEPFLSLWLQVADVQPWFLQEFWRSRRLAGISADPPAFGYQLAVAAPLALAALLHSPAGRGRMARVGWAAAFYLMLLTLLAALVIDGSRSAILACALGCAVVILICMRMPQVRRRLPLVAAALALGLAALFNPLFSIARAAGGGTGGADAQPTIEGPEHSSAELGRLATGSADALPTIEGPERPSAEFERLGTGSADALPTIEGPERPSAEFERLGTGSADALPTIEGPERPSAEFERLGTDSADAQPTIEGPERPSAEFERLGTDSADAQPTIEGLEAGSSALMRDSPDQPLVVAEIRRLKPRAKYRVQVRALQQRQPGPASEISAAPGSLGTIFLSWRMPEGASVAGYESRVRAEGASAWTRWAPAYVHRGVGLSTEAIAAQIRLHERRHEWKPNQRILWWSSPSVLSRLHMTRIAWQHALQHPLGAGRYAPVKSALSAELLEKNSAAMQFLQGDPHNQFLFVLADYGFPGLILLALFYLCAFRCPMLAAKAAHPSSDGPLLLLAAAVGGALIAYALHSLGHGRGPFTGDWGHFLLVGLAIAVQRIATPQDAPRQSARPPIPA